MPLTLEYGLMIGLVLFAQSWSFSSVLDCIRSLLLWHESLANKRTFLCFCSVLAQKVNLSPVRVAGTVHWYHSLDVKGKCWHHLRRIRWSRSCFFLRRCVDWRVGCLRWVVADLDKKRDGQRGQGGKSEIYSRDTRKREGWGREGGHGLADWKKVAKEGGQCSCKQKPRVRAEQGAAEPLAGTQHWGLYCDL